MSSSPVTRRPSIYHRVDGAGPALTLVHGVGARLESWDEVVARLQPRFRVIRLDLRGHGRSGRIEGACTLDDLASDVRYVWDELGVKKSHLAGFSLGGLIAQSLALSDPQRIEKLIILSAVAGRTEEERARVVQRLKLVQTEGIGSVLGMAEERWFTPEFRAAHPERVAARLKELRENDPRSYAAAYTVFATGDLGDRLHAIRNPTLVATGENDVGSNVRMARMMHERIPGSRLQILPRLRHSVLVEASNQVAELILDFLK
jgi:(E)-2-((N-methylformamido)methylene)succinate hydrolase